MAAPRARAGPRGLVMPGVRRTPGRLRGGDAPGGPELRTGELVEHVFPTVGVAVHIQQMFQHLLLPWPTLSTGPCGPEKILRFQVQKRRNP